MQNSGISKDHKKHRMKQLKNNGSSEEEEWVEAELVQKQQKRNSKRRCTDTLSHSSGEEITKKQERQRDKTRNSDNYNENKKRISKKRHQKRYNSSSDSSDKEENNSTNMSSKKQIGATRDEWMNLSTSFSSFSNDDRRKQQERATKQRQEEEKYNPGKSSRELNPYWGNGGNGLPNFQKPKNDDADDDSYRYTKSNTSHVNPRSGWRKKNHSPDLNMTCSNSSNSKGIVVSGSKSHNETLSKNDSELSSDHTSLNKPMTEKELNLLAGKLVKAEIMGNANLVNELKDKLEKGRLALENAKLQGEEVLLTQTVRQGYSKPLTLQSELGENSGSNKQRKKVVNTHIEKQRISYYPDDNKYSLKEMFENEKFNSGSEQDSEFMKIASNIRKNDDLDDLFADNIRRKKSNTKIDEANRSKAISEHKSMCNSLDNCSKCIQSASMQKHLIVSMGEYVYLGVPAHEPLLEGHCILVPIRHVPSVTQLDENEWTEIKNFRKALVRLFESKEQEPVFFEIANRFHRYPHMILECVPLPKEEGSMAPIYFKKAIEESETEWAQNKKLVSLKGRDVRRAIPKELPYFSVNFGLDEGFAHVIEDEKLFPRNFAQEIIGGILDLHHSKWRKPMRQSFEEQSKRVVEFSKSWKYFDCTS